MTERDYQIEVAAYVGDEEFLFSVVKDLRKLGFSWHWISTALKKKPQHYWMKGVGLLYASSYQQEINAIIEAELNKEKAIANIQKNMIEKLGEWLENKDKNKRIVYIDKEKEKAEEKKKNIQHGKLIDLSELEQEDEDI